MESFKKFCPLCYKQVIALSPRRIKDKFSLVFSKFSQIALVANYTRPHAITYTNYPEPIHTITRMVISINDEMHVRISAADLCKSNFQKSYLE